VQQEISDELARVDRLEQQLRTASTEFLEQQLIAVRQRLLVLEQQKLLLLQKQQQQQTGTGDDEFARAFAYCADDLERRIISWCQTLRSSYAKLKDS
jgi:hypothetical protein